jgi:hypothetical protein
MEVDFRKLFEQVQKMRKNSDIRYFVIGTANSAKLTVNKCLILSFIQAEVIFSISRASVDILPKELR